MSIVRKRDTKPPTPLTEVEAILAISYHFEVFRNLVFPNVHFCAGEMDVAVVTPSNYLWEIEIKLSLSDWKADAQKDKWKPKFKEDRKYVSRFYYAVPTKLIEKTPEFVPDSAGLIEIFWSEYWGHRMRVIKIPKPKRGQKITEKMKAKLMRKVYFKYWAKRFKDARE